MQTQVTVKARAAFSWKTWLLLTILSQIASLLSIPYGIYPATHIVQPIGLFILIQTFDLLFFGAIIALGIWLGDKIGLGVPLLKEWFAGNPEAPRRFKQMLPRTIFIGLIIGILLILQLLIIQWLMLRLQPTSQTHVVIGPPLWQGFLSAFGGGVREEILFRLVCMTFFVWLGTRLSRKSSPSASTIWIAIILSSLIFALAHLSQALAVSSTVAIIVVTGSLIGNCILGIPCGWLYWRYSLLTAMIVHFMADIATHVIVPVLLTSIR